MDIKPFGGKAMRRQNSILWISIISTIVVSPVAIGAVIIGQTDNFQDSTTQNWRSGSNNPNPPVNIADAGPAGSGDHVLHLSANGIPGPGGRLIAFNQTQWTGDFLYSGITGISLDVNNTGVSDLRIRLAFRNQATWFTSISPFFIPSGSGWQSTLISIADGDLLRLSGSLDYAGTMSSVEEMRILHSVDPAYQGDMLAASVMMDNITAVPEPTIWGVLSGSSVLLFAIWRRIGANRSLNVH